MSDGAPKRRLLLDRSNVNVDVHCLVVYMVRDGVGYFTGLSINCDDVTDGNDGSAGIEIGPLSPNWKPLKWCDPMATSTLVGIDMVSPPSQKGVCRQNRRRACRELELTASAHLFSKLTAASNDRTDTL